MAWPSPGDYSDAIQHPSTCFKDPVLRTGRVRTNKMGLPSPSSGNFAVVYQITSRTEKYAVRCFTRQVTDQQRRYDALSRTLGSVALPALVDFSYAREGIRIRNEWYPIVRMGWVAGRQLHRHVEDHLQEGKYLVQLAARWQDTVRALRSARIAHGDLQHGNVLVDEQGNIHLVDYDGMYIPALAGAPPDEEGHANYQHPTRSQTGYYGENLDAFPSIVIYASLRLLSVDPSLWSFHNGENLLFKKADFLDPGKTPIWGQLFTNAEPAVRQIAAALETCCRMSIANVQNLDTMLAQLPPAPAIRVVHAPPRRLPFTVPSTVRVASPSTSRNPIVASPRPAAVASPSFTPSQLPPTPGPGRVTIAPPTPGRPSPAGLVTALTKPRPRRQGMKPRPRPLLGLLLLVMLGVAALFNVGGGPAPAATTAPAPATTAPRANGTAAATTGDVKRLPLLVPKVADLSSAAQTVNSGRANREEPQTTAYEGNPDIRAEREQCEFAISKGGDDTEAGAGPNFLMADPEDGKTLTISSFAAISRNNADADQKRARLQEPSTLACMQAVIEERAYYERKKRGVDQSQLIVTHTIEPLPLPGLGVSTVANRIHLFVSLQNGPAIEQYVDLLVTYVGRAEIAIAVESSDIPPSPAFDAHLIDLVRANAIKTMSAP